MESANPVTKSTPGAATPDSPPKASEVPKSVSGTTLATSTAATTSVTSSASCTIANTPTSVNSSISTPTVNSTSASSSSSTLTVSIGLPLTSIKKNHSPPTTQENTCSSGNGSVTTSVGPITTPKLVSPSSRSVSNPEVTTASSTVSSSSSNPMEDLGNEGSSFSGVKRSASEMTSNAAENQNTESEGGTSTSSDPKRKKAKRDKGEPHESNGSSRNRVSKSNRDKSSDPRPTESCDATDNKISEVDKFSSESVEKKSELGPSSTGGGPVVSLAPKVPPLKIVLPSHSHGSSGSASSTSHSGSFGTNEDSGDNKNCGASNGANNFPYVVSSTTEGVSNKSSDKTERCEISSSELALVSSTVVSHKSSATPEISSSSSPTDKSGGGDNKEVGAKEEKKDFTPSHRASNEDSNSSHHSTTSREKESVSHRELKEKPQRVTRSSHRIAASGTVASAVPASLSTTTPNSPSGTSPKTSACPSPNHQEEVAASSNQVTIKEEKLDPCEPLEVHPRKRKLKKETTSSASSSSSNSGDNQNEGGVQGSGGNSQESHPPPPMLNCFEMFLNIRKQIERRRKNLFPVQPKPPQGFKDYLMNRATYVLAGNPNAKLAVPLLTPPPNTPQLMKEFYMEQEKVRHKLRIQHLVEKEKLVLSVEQEILRVHGRAARALSNQSLPFSVCTVLKDEEIYNLLTPEQEEKDRNARSRYNGRLFLSWLQDVDDKWDKIKESMLLRHHNEAESLHAVQKMDWEWKLKELALCESKSNPKIEDTMVPMVNVSDDFDLLPA